MPKTTPPPTPEARDRILEAAERLFAAKGYAATSVHEITDAAEVNRALLYYYFEDKHSLYSTLLDEGVARFNAMLEEALSPPGCYSDRLSRFIRGHLELIRRRGTMARMIHRCLLDGQQEEFRLVERFTVNTERLEAFFREAVESGEFRPLNVEITARTVLGPTFVFSLWNIYEGDRFDVDTLAEEISSQMLRGMRA